MADLARRENGGKIVMTTCSDQRHPAENMIDQSEHTFWVTTGMYPQEFVLDLGSMSKVTRITTLSRNVRRLNVESSSVPETNEFKGLIDVDLGPRPKQTESQGVDVTARYLKWRIASGYDNFAAITRISVLGERIDE
ncbi:hypothetical protein BSKO_03529 [Bryopsis sp. KO-2023]|nr:hypothetical protein BSKO_03529 [Bryopsis sp. KO-2023]